MEKVGDLGRGPFEGYTESLSLPVSISIYLEVNSLELHTAHCQDALFLLGPRMDGLKDHEWKSLNRELK